MPARQTKDHVNEVLHDEKSGILFSSLLFSSLLFSGFAQANLITLEAVEDNFVRGATPYDEVDQSNTVQDYDGFLVTKRTPSWANWPTSVTRKSWLSFDTSSLGLTESNSINTARFELVMHDTVLYDTQPSDQQETIHVFGLNDGIGDFWQEDSITWWNAPGNTNNWYVDTSETTLLGSFSFLYDTDTIESGPSFRIEGQSLIDFLMADTDDRVTFIVVIETYANNVWFESSETGIAGETTPRLVVDLADQEPAPNPNSVPAPATLALLGIGGILLLGSRKARRANS